MMLILIVKKGVVVGLGVVMCTGWGVIVLVKEFFFS
jgi:hypothetical protein